MVQILSPIPLGLGHWRTAVPPALVESDYQSNKTLSGTGSMLVVVSQHRWLCFNHLQALV